MKNLVKFLLNLKVKICTFTYAYTLNCIYAFSCDEELTPCKKSHQCPTPLKSSDIYLLM